MGILKAQDQRNRINKTGKYYYTNAVTLKGVAAIFLNNNLQFLIEWDGRQHYTGPEAKWSQGMSLKEIQFHDQLKNDYCKKNNLILKRIPYTVKNITIEDIFSDKFNI